VLLLGYFILGTVIYVLYLRAADYELNESWGMGAAVERAPETKPNLSF
jgi:hypothetical protein